MRSLKIADLCHFETHCSHFLCNKSNKIQQKARTDKYQLPCCNQLPVSPPNCSHLLCAFFELQSLLIKDLKAAHLPYSTEAAFTLKACFCVFVMIYKIMNGLCPDNLRGRLVTRSQIYNYPTRNQLDFDTPRQNLEFSKNSFSTLVQRRGMKSH